MASLSPVKRSSKLALSQSKSNISPGKGRRKPADEAKIKAVDELLNGPLPLDEETLAAKSKERTAELVKGTLGESEAIAALQQQLLVRDKYIEVLKTKLVDLSVESKVLESESAASRERMLQQQYKEKADLLRSLQALEQENQKLMQVTQSAEGGNNAEKENLELLIEGMTEESEQLKGQLAAKDTILANMKKDLEQLSGIIQEMTGLNKDLNEKIARLNGEMETKNKEHYQAMVKAQHIEETEKALAEQIGMCQGQEERIKKLTETTSRIQELEEAAEEFRTAAASLESRLPAEFRPQFESLKPILARFQVGSLRKQPEASQLKDRVKQLELELRATNRDLTRVSANESALRTRLSSQEAEHEAARKELKTVIDQLNKTVETLQSGFNGFNARNEKLAAELQSAKGEAQKNATKLITVQGKLEKATAAYTQAGKSESKALISLKEAQAQVSSLKLLKTTTESTLLVREQKVKEDAAKLKVLTEELWKRDTLILKKSAEVLKLEEQINALKVSLMSAHGRPKVMVNFEVSGSSRNPEGSSTASKGGKSSKLKNKASPARSSKFEKTLASAFASLSATLEIKETLDRGDTIPDAQLKAIFPEGRREGDMRAAVANRLHSCTREVISQLSEKPSDESLPVALLGRVKAAVRLATEDSVPAGELLRLMREFQTSQSS